MPPDWKTLDEPTAAALKGRVDDSVISVSTLTKPLFADGDSVVIAPTLQKGAALVITARRKAAPVAVDEPVHYSPLVEEIGAPAVPVPVEFAPQPKAIAEEPVIDSLPLEKPVQEPDSTFGPTTWERADADEFPAEAVPPVSETRSTDPEVWDLPSQAPPQAPTEVAPEEAPEAANSDWAEERFVATGFLGLEDYVEDQEEILRAKRPWWKRIFSN